MVNYKSLEVALILWLHFIHQHQLPGSISDPAAQIEIEPKW